MTLNLNPSENTPWYYADPDEGVMRPGGRYAEEVYMANRRTRSDWTIVPIYCDPGQSDRVSCLYRRRAVGSAAP